MTEQKNIIILHGLSVKWFLWTVWQSKKENKWDGLFIILGCISVEVISNTYGGCQNIEKAIEIL